MWNLFLTAGYEFHYSEINKANNPLKGNNMFNERFLSSALFFLSASPFSQPPELFIMLAALCYSPSYYISVLADQILLGLAVFLNLYFRFEPSQKNCCYSRRGSIIPTSGFMTLTVNKCLISVEKMTCFLAWMQGNQHLDCLFLDKVPYPHVY